MIAALEPRFRKYGVGLNSPGDIASVILGVVAGRHKRRGQEGVGATGVEEAREPCNGLAIFVAEGRAYEIDEGLDRTQSEWLGEDAVDCIERSSLIWSPVSLVFATRRCLGAPTGKLRGREMLILLRRS